MTGPMRTSGSITEMKAMRCPYCTIAMRPISTGLHGGTTMFYNDDDGPHRVEAVACPECEGVFLAHADISHTAGPGTTGMAIQVESNEFVLLPRVSSRPPPPSAVPEQYASLYREAALILNDSPRASGALSRRCLQQLLRDEAGVKPGNLFGEIEGVINGGELPSHAAESLHDLREIGNMSAHPNKSTATGDTLEVEPGEAEWTLDTLDALFDHYFIAPARTAARKASLAEKLGKGQ